MNRTRLKIGAPVLFLTFTFFLLHPTHCLAFLNCPDLDGASSDVNIEADQDIQAVNSSHDHHSAHNDLCGNLFTPDEQTWKQLLHTGPTCVGSGIHTARDLIFRTDVVFPPRSHAPPTDPGSIRTHLSLNVFLC